MRRRSRRHRLRCSPVIATSARLAACECGRSARSVASLPANTIDVVIFNCVINLSVAKPAVLAETYCMLAPGGRIGIPDVIAEDDLTTKERAECGSYAGYITEAFAEYHANPATAGFTTIEITPTHQVADGVHSAIIGRDTLHAAFGDARAVKPTTATKPPPTLPATSRSDVHTGGVSRVLAGPTAGRGPAGAAGPAAQRRRRRRAACHGLG